MKIPQVKPWLTEEEAEAAKKTITDNWITEGPLSAEFSKKLNELIGTEFGVFAPNGTLALFLGLLAIEIGPGDEVIVPDTTFIASANAVILTGATPVFAEVNDYNYQIDIAQCEKLITPRTKAIMPVHLYGMTADMDAIMVFAKKHSLKVIEDAAQAIGVKYREQHAGTFGDVGCFSFFADKTITTGEGGYVVCREKQIYEKLMLLRNQGRFDRGSFIHPAVGYNFRMTDLQSAVGLVQLKKLPEIIKRKLQILEWYKDGLKNVKEIKFLDLECGSEYAPFRVVLICERTHVLMEYLSKNEIQPRSFFYPLHKQPCFQYLDKPAGGQLDLADDNYKNSVFGYEHGVCFPVYPTLTNEEVRYICKKIIEFYAQS